METKTIAPSKVQKFAHTLFKLRFGYYETSWSYQVANNNISLYYENIVCFRGSKFHSLLFSVLSVHCYAFDCVYKNVHVHCAAV